MRISKWGRKELLLGVFWKPKTAELMLRLVKKLAAVSGRENRSV
jgi:hypothetical protein